MNVDVIVNGDPNLIASKELNELVRVAAKLVSHDDNISLSLNFVADDFIKRLNKKYRHKDSVTDVLSFSFQESGVGEFVVADEVDNLGEIYIATSQAKRQAEDARHSLDKELKILFIHGLFHLMGYDHENDDEADVMEALEAKVQKHI